MQYHVGKRKIMMNDLIEKLSNLRSQFNCFDENERDAYHTLSEAIKVLSKRPKPREDAVSRKDVLALAESGRLISNGNYKSVCKAIMELPSVTPKLSNIDFLMPESELTFYDNDHGFCINTQDVLEHIERYIQWER